MPEEAFDKDGLDGEWDGYYEQDSRFTTPKVPIRAVLTVVDDLIDGTMTDGITEHIHHFGKFSEVGILPPVSRLEGRIRGNRVRFTKRYLGNYVIYEVIGDRRTIVAEYDDHRVEYDGIWDSNARTIRGLWRIWPKGLLGRFFCLGSGDFLLARVT